MNPRRSLRLPIALAIVMIALLVLLTAGWVWMTVLGALKNAHLAVLYWTVLPIGTTFLVLVLVGVVVYLALSIKAINLNRRQSNFMDSVTHELKSPIAALKLYLQTLHRRQVSEEEQESFYQIMLDDVERLDHLINHVLEAGRLEREPVEKEVEDVPLADLLAECAETISLRYRIPRGTIELDTEPAIVPGRRVELEMIFRNLMDNAVKYAGAEPHVEVTLRAGALGTVTRISDNGRGIPPKMRRKIFGRFVRLGLELERDKPGTGLGLYIVRTLVGRMKGRIRVYDRELGSGTVFEVRLPGRPVEVSPVQAEPDRAVEKVKAT